MKSHTVGPLTKGHPDERPPPLVRPLNVNLNINVLTSTPDKRPPLLKGHFSDGKGVASHEGFHCISHKNVVNPQQIHASISRHDLAVLTFA